MSIKKIARSVLVATAVAWLPATTLAENLYGDAPVFLPEPMACAEVFANFPGYPPNTSTRIKTNNRTYDPFESTDDVRFVTADGNPGGEVIRVEVRFAKGGNYTIGREGFAGYAQSVGLPDDPWVSYALLKSSSLPFTELQASLGNRGQIFAFKSPDFIFWGVRDIQKDGRRETCTWYRTDFFEIEFFNKIKEPYLGS